MSTKRIRLLGAVLLLTATLSQYAHAELAVIANPDNPLVGISRDDVKDIFLGKVRSFPGGSAVEPVDQVTGSETRDHFNRVVLDMSEGKRKSHWSRLMFTGKAKPPKTMESSEAVMEWVATHSGALGYISGSEVDKRVKVLLILP